MRAMVADSYGPPEVFKLADIPVPTPKDDEVRIKIHAAALNAADWHLLRADPFLVRLMFGPFKPKTRVLGADVAGVVETVGKSVTRFKVGDEVFACLNIFKLGGFAEKVCAEERYVVLKPSSLSFEEAAAIPLAAITAWQGLRQFGPIEAGQKVLINGASGGVGTYALQIAKALGAEVTAVCSSRNVEQCRSLGADHVIDYSRENFTKNGLRYDVIFAANGYHPLKDYQASLSPTGRYMMSGGAGKQMTAAICLGPWYSKGTQQKLGRVDARANGDDLASIKALIDQGKLKPVIDRRYKLEALAQALRYLEEGHAQGKIVIQVQD